eukprot:TRINITY_DN291_c1_g1_i1.p1 TRINITY_DN291_c1_g1~~TRINITY_DN291_c1_g1_i1.p1  ORF type:complete len:760 (+),score=216.65 TRINITY_DN291_c1_g1_i1:90-2369(+)
MAATEQTLSVRVLGGRDLIPCDRGKTSDPYCIATLGAISHRTKVIKKTLSPDWTMHDQDPFLFHIDQHTPSELVFEVFDWNRVQTHKRMGRVRLPIAELFSGQEFNKWMPLLPSKESDRVSGEIHVSAQFFKEGVPMSHRTRGTLRGDTKHSFNQDLPEEEPPLFTAIKNSELETVRKLVNSPDTDINMRDRYGYTPLHAACVLFSDRDDEILSLLLRHKDINVNIENEDKNTPLHYFCQKFRSPNCQDAFEIFMEKGANVNASNNLGETPLHKAIFNNSVKILMVNMLIKAKADVNKTNSQGETALHYVVRFGREDLVTILLKGGADVTIRGLKDKKTPYELAVEQNHDKIAAILNRAKELDDWLEDNGMEKYYPAFLQEEIYKDLLPDLDDKTLDRMSVNIPTGHRLKILKAAKALKEEQERNRPAKVEDAKEESDAPAEKDTAINIEMELARLKYINKSGTWILHNSELEFAMKLGSGTSGTVYKGLYRGEEVAIKVLKSEQSSKELEEFKKEFQIMSSIQNPYLVFFFGAVLEPKMCMVMELCSRGSLYHVMSDLKNDLNWERTFSMAKEMVKGVDCLHSWTPQIVHRDLKSLNLMVNEKWHVKVADFGLSRFNTDTQKDTLVKMRGTFAYCAPEVYFGEHFSAKADVFSIAIILWELVTRCIKREYMRPYQEFPNLHFDFQIIIQTAKKGVRPTIPPACPESLSALIRSSWDHEADKRPTCQEILEKLEAIEEDFKNNTETWNNLIEPLKESSA